MSTTEMCQEVGESLADLLTVMREAEAGCSALIIDSITHPYRELIAAYLRKMNRTFLQIEGHLT